MIGLLIPVLFASAIAALRVGSVAGLQRARIQWWPLAFGSIVVQLLLFNPPIDRQSWAMALGPAIWVASLGALVAVLVRNCLGADCARAAFGIAALGVAANLFVVLANYGYMPQSPEARLAARGVTLDVPGAAPRLHNVVPSGPDTRFGWLGDVIAEPAWLPTANVISIGDVVLSVALAWWAFQVITNAPLAKVRRRLADSH